MKNDSVFDKTENIPSDCDSSENEFFPSIMNMDYLIQEPNQETLLAQSQIAQEAIIAATSDQFRILLVENALNNIVVLTAFAEHVTRDFSDSIQKCQQIVDAYIEATCEQIKLWGGK